ncbi:unnamed protein product [Pleuronectes platessa]|uniref:Uncharacterized protein n=1 Tax=Pleuronectes platessa TaxID=8262 RepID=A0A9N7UCV2_PLEPL|nr:unnamed protein product [Pleuronectes platessa]
MVWRQAERMRRARRWRQFNCDRKSESIRKPITRLLIKAAVARLMSFLPASLLPATGDRHRSLVANATGSTCTERSGLSTSRRARELASADPCCPHLAVGLKRESLWIHLQ